MLLYTNDGKEYNIKWLEYWNENEGFFLAEDTNGEILKIGENDFNKVKQ